MLRQTADLLLICVTATCAQDTELLHKLVLFSDAAYCGDTSHGGTDSITQWSCPACKAAKFLPSGGNLLNISVFQDPSRQTFGFSGVTDGWTGGDYVVVSFRGSVLMKNYIDDIDVFLVTPPGGRGGRVHRGMHLAYQTLKQDMLHQVDALLARHTVKGILVTGHSLGAGMSVYGADDLASIYPSMQVTLYSFGTPRPGDVDFITRLNSTANLETWAVAHRADIVPMIYPEYLGFHQISRNIWYPEDLAPAGPGGYIVCDGSGEDPACEDSLAEKLLNWDDHNAYVNHSMYCCDATSVYPSPGCAFPFSSSLRTLEGRLLI